MRSSKEELGVGPRTEPWIESASASSESRGSPDHLLTGPPLGLTPSASGLGTVVDGEGIPIEAGGVAVGVVLLLPLRM